MIFSVNTTDFSNFSNRGQGMKRTIEGDFSVRLKFWAKFTLPFLPPPISKHQQAVLAFGASRSQGSHLANLYVCALFLKCTQTPAKAWAYVCVGLGCRLADGAMAPRFLQKSTEAFHHFMEINRKAISECIIKCYSPRIAWKE